MQGLELLENRIALARQIAEESMVLLENKEGCLPLLKGTYAWFGRACYNPVIGGFGSGDSARGKEIVRIPDVAAQAGLVPVKALDDFYRNVVGNGKRSDPIGDLLAQGVDLVASGILYELFGQYRVQEKELELPEDLLKEAEEQTDTAVYVMGRSTGGEECDRHLKDDYYLLESEKELLRQLDGHFKKVVLVLNINGLIDLSWIRKYKSIHAVIFAGAFGEQGAEALVNLLSGAALPCGKLAFTIAKAYEDYPSAADFSFDKDEPGRIKEYKDYGLSAAENGSLGFAKSPVTVYREDIYAGYRCFDTFGKEVLYPFGYGLTYGSFIWELKEIGLQKDGFEIKVKLKNISEIGAGKETLQLYVSKPNDRLEQPYQELTGCRKSKRLAPGEETMLGIFVPWRSLASYDERRAAWVLCAGKYILRLGNSSRNTHVAAILELSEEILYEQVKNELALHPANRGKIDFLSAKGAVPISYPEEQKEIAATKRIEIRPENIAVWAKKEPGETACPPVPKERVTLQDVFFQKADLQQLVGQMTAEELAVLAAGYGPGLPFGGMGQKLPETILYEDGTPVGRNTHPVGGNGYVSPALEKYKIPSTFYKDGPAGTGQIAWPTQMLAACSFDEDLLELFGEAAGYEAKCQQVDSWLAPAVNLMRNPLGGRNFEYFSEDPVLTAIYAKAVSKGASRWNITVCPKHFAVNEQETYRRGNKKRNYDAVDSVLTERAARELYLRPFEEIIRSRKIGTVMTSFNKINGTFAAGNKELCGDILRNEWGFEGVVVTDWGDMDIVVDGADAVAAGNDVVMPGGPPVIKQILQGFQEGRVTRKQLETAAMHLLQYVIQSNSFLETVKDRDGREKE